jgi:hypothetical protein
MPGALISAHSRRGALHHRGALPAVGLIALFLTAVCAPAQAAKYALIVGLNEYQNVRSGIVELKFAIADVQAIDVELRKLGFSTRLLENDRANRKTIVRELNRISYLARPEDTFLLYFAGHGVRRATADPTTYWLTYEAELEALDDQGIRLPHLLDYVRDIRAQQKLVFLDHCYSGDAVDKPTGAQPVEVVAGGTGGAIVADGSRGPPTTPPRELVARGQMSAENLRSQIPASTRGMLVVAAARNEAFESPTIGHGFFTHALLKALTTREASGGSPRLTVPQLLTYLRAQVPTLSGNRQEVTEYTDGANTSSWVFVDALPEPVVDVTAARTKRDRWSERMVNWENAAFLDADIRFKCEEALDKWIDSLRSPTSSMSPPHDAIFKEVEKRMRDGVSEETLGRDLNRAIRRIVAPPPP